MSQFLSLHVSNRTSETRDMLMTERTTLSWIKFSCILSVSGMAVCFRTSDQFGRAMGIVFVCLSLATLLVTLVHYWQSVNSYRAQKTQVAHPTITSVYLGLVILILLGVNIGLMLKKSEEEYAQ